MKPFLYDITGLDYLDAFRAVKDMPYSLLLDSSDENHPGNRYSFVACYPIETIMAKDGKIEITNWDGTVQSTTNPLALLQARLKHWIENTETLPNLPPFQGGAAGLFGYDLGRYIEKVPDQTKNKSDIPDMAVGIYDQVLAYDHLLKKTYIFTHAKTEEEAIKKRKHLIKLFRRQAPYEAYTPQNIEWESNFTESDYKEAVQKVIDYIHAGDIFQANLSQRFEAPLPDGFNAFTHYEHMRGTNPAPFSCFQNLGNIQISSASPERFVTVRDRKVETCPIKGTRARVENFAQDRINRNDLIASEKDNAENTMIVDLLRNDLSKNCTPHSVNVADLCKLESFSNVHHLVSRVHGILEKTKTPIDLLYGCFPGGSITGAPKIRAMEIIEELEHTRRGAYCGSMGYIGFDGNMDTNILIRTMTYEKGHVSLQAGGGIIADSNPNSEYQETLDKASGLLNSFDVQPSHKYVAQK